MHFRNLILVPLLLLLGCSATANTGNRSLTQDNVSQIKKGVSTRADVERLLGPASSVSMMGDGRRMMMYSGGQQSRDYSGTAMMGLPLVGGLFPVHDTAKVRSQLLQILLTKNDVVEDYQFSDSTTNTNTSMSLIGGHVDESTTQNH